MPCSRLQRAELIRNDLRLVAFVVAHDRLRLLALTELRRERLVLPLLIVLDERVRAAHDRRGRTKVLPERNRRRLGIVPFEIQDVAQVRAAPAVNRLIGIADDAEVAVARRELMRDGELRVVGVLILVDQDVLEALLIRVAHRVLPEKHLRDVHQEVIEVEGVVLAHDAAVRAVRPRDRAGVEVERLRLVCLRIEQLVLGVADHGRHRRRREVLVRKLCPTRSRS